MWENATRGFLGRVTELETSEAVTSYIGGAGPFAISGKTQ